MSEQDKVCFCSVCTDAKLGAIAHLLNDVFPTPLDYALVVTNPTVGGSDAVVSSLESEKALPMLREAADNFESVSFKEIDLTNDEGVVH